MNSTELAKEVEAVIRNVPDFPVPGIQFKDITPMLRSPEVFEKVVNHFADFYKDKGITGIVGIESRGFIFGAPLALKMGLPFILARKAGKLPSDTVSFSYELEYGTATLELHKDALTEADNVVVFDDLLATGGTAGATIQLVEMLNAKVASCAFVIELDFLKGKDAIIPRSTLNPNMSVESLLHY